MHKILNNRKSGARPRHQPAMSSFRDQTGLWVDRYGTQTRAELLETNSLLTRAAHRYQELFQGLPVICFCYDPIGDLFEWNREAENATGFGSTELMQKPIWELYGDRDGRAYQKNVIRQVFNGQTFEGVEIDALRSDGQTFPVLSSTYPIFDLDGQIVGAINANIDISRLKNAELALRMSQEQLKLALGVARLASWEFVSNGISISLSTIGAEMLGIAPSSDVIRLIKFESLVHPDDFPLVKSEWLRGLAGQEQFQAEFRIIRPNGEIRWIDARGRFFHDACGDVTRLVGTALDNTERKHHEETISQNRDFLEARVAERTSQLSDANELLHTEIAERTRAEQSIRLYADIVANMQIGVFVYRLHNLDDDGSLCLVAYNDSAEAYVGSIPGDAIGKPIGECFPVLLETDLPAQFAETARSGIGIELSDVVIHENTLDRAIFSINTFKLPDQCVGISCENVTERRYLELQLVQSQKLESIGQLAAGIAHEINTPVQYVGDNVHFLSDAFADLAKVARAAAAHSLICPVEAATELQRVIDKADMEFLFEEVPKALSQSIDGLDRVAHIVHAMKEFSHPGRAEKSAIDLNHTIESTITVAKNEWKYVANVVTDFDHSLPPVQCLPAELNQVFLNMIVNSAHSIADVVAGTELRGTIRITTRWDLGTAVITIADTGAGIPSDIVGRIFDPFFTTKAVGQGTGQGLAIAHSAIVDKHHGEIDVSSEVGKGTVFTIRLPLIADKEEAAA